MRATYNILISVFMIYPYIIGFSPGAADSSSTVVKLIVGRGSYADVSRDCEGNPVSVTDIPFEEGLIAVDHQRGDVRAGIKAGVINTHDGIFQNRRMYYNESDGIKGKTYYFAGSDIGLQWHYVGINAGLIYFSDIFNPSYNVEFDRKLIPSVSLRVGNPETYYLTTGFASNLPLLSGGGLFDIGVGTHLNRPAGDIWVGLGLLPYDAFMLAIKGDIEVAPNVILLPRSMIGLSSASFQYSLSFGAAVRF